MSQERTVKLNIDAKDALKRLEAVEKELANIGRTAKKTEQGTSALATGFRGIGLAWKAIGIGAVITALQFLADKFTANQEIMDKVNIASAVFGDVMTKIGTVVISVVKGLGLLGKAVGKVLRGEFKEAGDLAKQSFDGVKEAVVGNSESFSDFIKNAKEGAKATVEFAKATTNMRNEVKLADAQQRQLQLTYQRDAELQRQLRDDISLTFEERIAANEELGRILDEQFTKEQELANKKISLAELELSRNKSNIDLQVALIDAKTELADLEERITGQRSEQLTNLNSLEKEYQDSLKTTEKVVKQTAKEEIAITKLTQEQKAGIISGALGQISGALGENSKAGKAMAIGQALIDTYTGANKALAQGGIFGAISAAGIIASGLANVARIKSTNPETGSGGGGGGGDTNVPQPTGLGGAGLIPNLENINQNDLGTPEPVQAFVVENDISNAQALQEELEIQATL
jgi:hypothetical protein